MPLAERSAFNFGQLRTLNIVSGRTVSRRGDTAAGGSADRLELDFSGWSHGGRWALQLDVALSRPGDPILVVAHGLACLAVAWWAQLSPRTYLERVGGALFVSPLSFSPSEAAAARSLRPSPGTKLPFPSIVTSPASPIIEQVLDLADIWGSQFVDADASDRAIQRTLQDHPLARQSHLADLIATALGRTPEGGYIDATPALASALLVPARD